MRPSRRTSVGKEVSWAHRLNWTVLPVRQVGGLNDKTAVGLLRIDDAVAREVEGTNAVVGARRDAPRLADGQIPVPR
jgi:hypothetical protein